MVGSVVWWEKCGMVGKVWYCRKSVVWWEKCGIHLRHIKRFHDV